MQVEELILINSDKVRRDSNLMSLYLKFFKEAYSYTPSCAGCSFNDDWIKFVSFYSKNTLTLPNKKIEIMKGITIKKTEGSILAYKIDGVTYRKYDTALTPEFIDGFLKNGTEEEITDRKKLFNLPKEKTEKVQKTKSVVKKNNKEID